MQRLVSVDIGSTYTKGALFRLADGKLSVEARHMTPTTVEDLTAGVRRVLSALAGSSPPESDEELFRRFPLHLSSSARGGLRIAAVGLTPALTLEAARMTACSAGGRVVKAFSYSLTEEDVRSLEEDPPDIVLLTGGTDGGNRKFVLENARRLASSRLTSTIVYAGNRSAVDEVKRILAEKDLRTAPNVMPEVGTVRPEAAREVIREVFLDTICEGKGLGHIRRLSGTEPRPTPSAVLDLMRILPEKPPFFPLLVVDMGGATTDVYSRTGDVGVEPGVVLRGLPEPPLKRTVEGDLGLRVSVRSLRESARNGIARRLEARGIEAAELDAYVERAAGDHALVPRSAKEKACEEILAASCLEAALLRHAGRRRKAATPSGTVWVQRGKDLRGVKAAVGTGGYLARTRTPPLDDLFAPVDENGEEILLPGSLEWWRDGAYLWPLLGNLAGAFPEPAAALALESLERIEDNGMNEKSGGIRG